MSLTNNMVGNTAVILNCCALIKLREKQEDGRTITLRQGQQRLTETYSNPA